MIFKNINRWDIIKMSDNIIPSGNCIWEKNYSCILKNGILFHEMYYYNYYFDCTKVCGGEGVCLSDKKVSCYSQSYVSAKCAYTSDVQIRIPILIPHRV